MRNVIIVKDLKKQYQSKLGTVAAVDGISFSVEQGEIFGILGPNGAGKTTTLEILEGLKNQTNGTIEVLGFDNLKASEEIKQRIGVQLQSSEYLPSLKLGELLSLFSSLYKNRSEAKNNLGFVGLEKKENEVVKNLSGGQKQRFSIAMSLVSNPEILFLDEPTTGLDPKARRDMWELIRKIQENGITVVITTHYMEEAEYLCDRVAIMDKGKILTINNPKTLINDLSHTTQVSFLTSEKLPESLWQPISNSIEKIFSNYPKVILEIKSLDAVKSIIDLLHEKELVFSGFTVKTATLEDVYLDLTGKEYEL